MLMEEIKKFRDRWHRDIKYGFLLRRIDAYNSNEMLRHQGIDWEEFDEYRFWKKFHTVLAYHSVKDEAANYVRVGGDGDGGYVMAAPLSRTKIAYSFGIGKDVSWDMDIAKRGYEVYMYDHTIEKLPENHKKFHWRKKGITGEEETKELKRLDTFIKANGHAGQAGMLLKIDVEGFEWEVLKRIDPDTLNKFDQIVIELHGTHSHDRKPMMDALGNLTKHFAVIHLHAQNGGPVSYCGNLVTPDTIETTLVNKSVFDVVIGGALLPTEFDRPVSPFMPEVWIGKWNP